VGRFRAGTILVSAQLALSLALVAVGGLFMRSAANVAAGSAGFALDRHLVVALDPSLAGYSEARTRTLYGAVLERVRALPGVERASLASMVPFGEFRESKLASLPGEPETTEANFTIVTSDYFDTLRVPVLRGRGFDGADDERQADLPSAVVNDPLARRLFGDVDPVGRLVDVRQGPEVQRFLVTGVVPGTAMDLFDAEPAPHLYVPYGSRFRAAMTLHVATAPDADETAVLGVIRRTLRELDPQLPVLSARTMSSQRDASLTHWASRAAAVMFSAFSALALLLATIGVYGLKAYDVARRTRELAIRIALGATSGDVARLVVADGLGPAAVGLLAGLLLALALGQLASSFLFRVNPYDAVTLAAACLVLGGVTAAAAYLPARRAVRIAPLEALRAE
jgi:predicted permease